MGAIAVIAAGCVPFFSDASLTVKAVAGAPTQANLIWNPAFSDAATAISYYAIAVNGVDSAHVFAPATNCTLQGLKPSTSYTFTVTAYNAKSEWSGKVKGSIGSLTANYTTPAGAQPTVSLGCVNPTSGALDTDHDGLPDWAETNTGVYVNPGNTGTSKTNADTDGDGIPDGAEVLGTTAGLPLQAYGANPLHKDIFIEADWYQTTAQCGYTYSTQPTAAEITRVKNAFASAPVTNPDGHNGINFVVDYGQGVPFTGGNKIAGTGVITGGVTDPAFRAIKAANFSANRQGYFHYMLMAAQYGGSNSSGIAELPGNDFIVSLPNCFTLNATHNGAGHDEELANTIMHELGHNLNLHHGGSDDVNYKFNYNSVMNYWYQGDGVDTTCDAFGDHVLNYSTGSNISLNEAALNEHVGVCGTTAHPIDWNGSGTFTSPVAVDLNGNGILDSYSDFNDWAHVDLSGLNNASGVAAHSGETPTAVVEQPAVRRGSTRAQDLRLSSR